MLLIISRHFLVLLHMAACSGLIERRFHDSFAFPIGACVVKANDIG
jgi:hypothetical protein